MSKRILTGGAVMTDFPAGPSVLPPEPLPAPDNPLSGVHLCQEYNRPHEFELIVLEQYPTTAFRFCKHCPLCIGSDLEGLAKKPG